MLECEISFLKCFISIWLLKYYFAKKNINFLFIIFLVQSFLRACVNWFMADDTNQIFFIITTACLHQCSIKKYNIFFEIWLWFKNLIYKYILIFYIVKLLFSAYIFILIHNDFFHFFNVYVQNYVINNLYFISNN